MENIIAKPNSKLSNMWSKILNLENGLLPEIKEQFGTLSTKEEKLIKILDFAQIENNILSFYEALNIHYLPLTILQSKELDAPKKWVILDSLHYTQKQI
ncbi:MAG: hypothetical protein DRG78_10925 [Epsilonproteobacteria bacterium]|nr:MAG: hypothetical protein DRG78_10925 [Campylobacterota bacterium]